MNADFTHHPVSTLKPFGYDERVKELNKKRIVPTPFIPLFVSFKCGREEKKSINFEKRNGVIYYRNGRFERRLEIKDLYNVEIKKWMEARLNTLYNAKTEIIEISQEAFH